MSNRALILPQLVVLVSMTFLLVSCTEDRVDTTYTYFTPEEYAVVQDYVDLPAVPDDYQTGLPDHALHSGIVAPEIDAAKATLGRVLFYDTKLSKNESVSCASCHKQELAFSDDKAFSEGFDGELTRRNSLPLAASLNFVSSYGDDAEELPFGGPNLGFFWDERVHNIVDQSRATITDEVEMGMDMQELTKRLQAVPAYQILYRKAFGSSGINEENTLLAIREFLNSLVSANAEFDRAMSARAGFNPLEDFSDFSAAENLGKRLYMLNCSGCHGHNMVRTFMPVANNGLDLQYEDQGKGELPGAGDVQNGVFKVPFLRNIALTAPYMHDGRFATLEEVIEHYSTGIQPHENLHDLLLDPEDFSQPIRMNFSEEEKAALLAFLHTLTDDTLPSDTRFSNPFR